ncbi:DUF883 domain-containing protein [uncultured Sulfitobacter sp.]|uniref:DUF883 family protein n=1 Tax=uncultured Sulfitobacter sp. TaxID=191468 RepID=UPI00262B7DFE|nr:DUF883 domain-containing protein [uncultured Sulfitobacter sp.]
MAKTSATLNIANAKELSVDDLAAQIQTLKDDLSILTQTLSEYGTAKAENAAQTAQAKAAELKAAGQDKVVEAQLHAEEFVRTQPATSLGLAAGLGFLVGMIAARR